MSFTASMILAVIASLGCIAGIVAFLQAEKERTKWMLRSWVSACILMTGMALMPQGSEKIVPMILLGAALEQAADLILHLRPEYPQGKTPVILTAGIFSVAGYCFCINGLMTVAQPEWEGVLSLFVVGIIATLYYKKKQGIHPGKLLIPAFFHLFAALFMGCMALALLVRNFNMGFILMALGGISQIISGNAGLAHRFGRKPTHPQGLVSRLGFWLGPLLIGWSVLFL